MGTVTFLFTDIERSTELLRAAGPAYAELLDAHRRLLRDAFAAHGGREVDTQGDSFFVAFASPGQAVAASAAAQRALARHPWPGQRLVKVRMGLHTGEAATVAGGYVGLEVHRAARIAAVAHGGQVVMSEATAALVRDALPERTTTRDLGEHRLKDFSRPERLYQLDVEGLPVRFPPLSTLARRKDLPVHLGSFVGRDRELEDVTRLLLDEDVRLLTLTGPGGIGKTRLAIQVAAGLEDRFDDGSAVVMLAPVRDPSLVVPAITQALGLAEAPGRSHLEVLTDYLCGRHLLLVLDNFEHVIDSASAIAGLLRVSQRLKVLVTSREVLRVYGEREFVVPPLLVPDDTAPEKVRFSDAVRLFVDRAQAARPEFALTDENVAVVAEICRQLDGLPLAIELAAARVRLMPPEMILRKLGSRLTLLTGGPRDLPERQRTLRTTIAWSYDLLDDPDRRQLERLAVFAGGCSLDAADTVLCPGGGKVLEVLSSLVEKSLLRAQGVVGGEARFSMLETLREFALERLEDRGEAELARRQHTDFFLQLAERAKPHVRTGDQDVWLERLIAESDNLRAAMRWALDHNEPGRVARMGAALWPLWWVQGDMLEGVGWMDEALRSEETLSAEERAMATLVLGILAFGWGDYPRAVPALHQAEELCRSTGDGFGLGMALALSGVICAVTGDMTTGEHALAGALDAFEGARDGWGVAFARYALGRVLLLHGRIDEAMEILQQSVAQARGVAEKQLLALALLNLGWSQLEVAEVDSAKASLIESLQLTMSLHNKIDAARALEALAAVAASASNPERGALLFGAAEGVCRSIGAGVWLPDRTSHDRTEQALRSALGTDAFEAQRAEGVNFSVEEALDLASEL